MSEMSVKERLIGAITGEKIDRVPWSPFLAYYWDFVDREIADQGQHTFLKALGADPLLRGFHHLFRVKRNRCDMSDVTNGNTRIVTYETPVGTIKEVYTYAQAARTWFLTGHPVSTIEELKTLQFIYENTKIIRDSRVFDEDYDLYKDDALLLPVIGTHFKTGIQSMVEHWLGTEELTYAMMDYPEAIDECLSVMRQRDLESVEISIDSRAEGFIFWEDSSTTNLSPDSFVKYAAPQINEWGEMIHQQGKLLIHHACGHLKALLPLMAKTNIDAIESISPPPTGNIEICDAFSLLPEHIALIGGIEPTVLLQSKKQDFEVYISSLITENKKHRFVLANSDSCPPNVEREKFLMVSKMVRKLGRYS